MDIAITAPSAGPADIRSFGAIGDGRLHRLSERYATVAEAQAAYPTLRLTQSWYRRSIDWAAIQAALDTSCAVHIPAAPSSSTGRSSCRRTGSSPGAARGR
jgi:hypothetical protein